MTISASSNIIRNYVLLKVESATASVVKTSTTNNPLVLIGNYCVLNGSVYALTDLTTPVKTNVITDNTTFQIGFMNYYISCNSSGNKVYLLTQDLDLVQKTTDANIWYYTYTIPYNQYILAKTIDSKLLKFWQNPEGGTLIALTRNNVTYYDISDSNAVPANLLVGKSAYTSIGRIVGSMPNNGALSYTPTTSQQSIPAGYTSGGTIGAVTSAIDANITQANIRSGITILGVTGNLEPDKPDQTKTCTPSTSQQIIEPDIGYELASVTVEAVDMTHADYLECQELADLILGNTETTDLDYILINPLIVDQNSNISVDGNNLVINTGGTVNE